MQLMVGKIKNCLNAEFTLTTFSTPVENSSTKSADANISGAK